MDIIVFDVELGQSIFFYPRKNPEYGLLVDCGNTSNFEPVDKLIEWKLLPKEIEGNKPAYRLRNLTISNYDQDHFSGLPYLKKRVKIQTVRLPKNLSADEILALKDRITLPISDMVDIVKTYTHDVTDYNPPQKTWTYHLNKSDFPNEEIDTNKLSQIVFVLFNGTMVCIPGDLTSPAWDRVLLNEGVRTYLSATDIFVASHHGREDGYNSKVFEFCKPECIIMSDKFIVHATQEGMASLYGKNVKGNGIVFNGDSQNLRRVLTTRTDGHIWIRIEENAARVYKSVQ